MSMSAYPAFGYLMKLEDFLDKLSPAIKSAKGKKALTNLLSDLNEGLDDEDEALAVVQELCNEADLLAPANVFHLGDEDFPCELETGVEYVGWREDDLYIAKPSEALKALKKAGIEPFFESWAYWG